MGFCFLRAREAASPLFFFANPVGGERCSSKELRGRSPTAGRRRGKLMVYRRSARSGFRAGKLVSLSVGACGGWAPRAALD